MAGWILREGGKWGGKSQRNIDVLLLLVLKVPSPDATAIALVLKESILASLENPYWYLLLQRKQFKS